MTRTSSSNITAPDQGPWSGVWTLGPWEAGPPRARDDHDPVSTLSLHLQSSPEGLASRPGPARIRGRTSPCPHPEAALQAEARSAPTLRSSASPDPADRPCGGPGAAAAPHGAARRWRDCSEASDSPTGTPERPAEHYRQADEKQRGDRCAGL